MKNEIEETRRHLITWIEVEEMRRGGNGDSPLRELREKARVCQDLISLMDLEVEVWRALGYDGKALENLRTAGELAEMDTEFELSSDVARYVLQFIEIFTLMPSHQKTAMWVLMKKVEETLRELGFSPMVVMQVEWILEAAFRKGKLNHVLAPPIAGA